MSIQEQDLPGIGRRYDIAIGMGRRVMLVIHHSGRRDLYVLERGADEPAFSLDLTGDQARRLAAIPAGGFFKPAVVDEIEDLVGEFVVDWVTLAEDSPAVGRSIQELEIRRRTGLGARPAANVGLTLLSRGDFRQSSHRSASQQAWMSE